MSEANVEIARRGYMALTEAYKTGDLRRYVEEICDPEIVLNPAGILPDSSGEMRGHQGMIDFVLRQGDAFEPFSIQPEEFIDAGRMVVVPMRLGGRARYTGLEVEFYLVHVATFRAGKILRIDVYASKADALKAVGLEG